MCIKIPHMGFFQLQPSQIIISDYHIPLFWVVTIYKNSKAPHASVWKPSVWKQLTELINKVASVFLVQMSQCTVARQLLDFDFKAAIDQSLSCPFYSAVPDESSCKPTSNDSLSVRDLEVFRQARYC